MTQPRQYRTREQWQSIMADFALSNLSAPQFCQINELPYGSFAKWRQKLSTAEVNQVQAGVSPSFLDLNALTSASSTDSSVSSHWHITLKLGNGVELLLSQG